VENSWCVHNIFIIGRATAHETSHRAHIITFHARQIVLIIKV